MVNEKKTLLNCLCDFNSDNGSYSISARMTSDFENVGDLKEVHLGIYVDNCQVAPKTLLFTKKDGSYDTNGSINILPNEGFEDAVENVEVVLNVRNDSVNRTYLDLTDLQDLLPK